MRVTPVQNYNRYLNDKSSSQKQAVFGAKNVLTVSKKLEIPKKYKSKIRGRLNLRDLICTITEGNVTPEIKKEFDSKTGKLLKITQYYKNKIAAIYEFNHTTGKMTKEISFNDHGIRSTITEFDEATTNIKKITQYRSNGKTIDTLVEYNTKTMGPEKVTIFQKDGKTIDAVGEYNPTNGYMIKDIKYRKDGTRIYAIKDFSPENGKLLSTNLLYKDGKTVKTHAEYDLESQPAHLKILKYTNYYPDGRIKSIEDPVENLVHFYMYNDDKTLDYILNKPFDNEGFESRTRIIEQGVITFSRPRLAIDNKDFDPTKPRTTSTFKPIFVEDNELKN